MSRAHELIDRTMGLRAEAEDLRDTVEAWGLDGNSAVGLILLALASTGQGARIAQMVAEEEAAKFPEDPSHRRGAFICTYTRRRFWPLDPRPEEVAAEDIAHALSLKTRWGGFCRRLYTVGEHSLNVADIARQLADRECPELAPLAHAHGLLHDGEEAYLPDVPRPVKAFLRGWQRIADRVQRAVLTALEVGQPPAEVAEIVTRADDIVLLLESRALFEFDYDLWYGGLPEHVEVPAWATLTPYGETEPTEHVKRLFIERLAQAHAELDALAELRAKRVEAEAEAREVYGSEALIDGRGPGWQGEVKQAAATATSCKVCGVPTTNEFGLCDDCGPF